MYTYIHCGRIKEAVTLGKPFKVRLEYREGTSDKWWELTYDPFLSNYVLCNHGRTGSAGRFTPFEYDAQKAAEKAWEKIEKGYDHVSGSWQQLPEGMFGMADAGRRVKLPPPYEQVTRLTRAGDAYRAEDAEGNLISLLSVAGAEKLKKLMGAA